MILVSEDAQARIDSARGVEGQSRKRQQQAKRHKELLNQFQEFVQDTKHRIEDTSIDISTNMFALNEPCLQDLICKWQRWFQESDQHDVEELENKLKEIKEERDRVQKEFAETYRKQCEEEEEANRIREEEAKRKEEIEWQRLIEEEKLQELRSIELWKSIFEKSHDLSKWVSASDQIILSSPPKFVIDMRLTDSFADPRFKVDTLPLFLQSILRSSLIRFSNAREMGRYNEFDRNRNYFQDFYRDAGGYQYGGQSYGGQPYDDWLYENQPYGGQLLRSRIYRDDYY